MKVVCYTTIRLEIPRTHFAWVVSIINWRSTPHITSFFSVLYIFSLNLLFGCERRPKLCITFSTHQTQSKEMELLGIVNHHIRSSVLRALLHKMLLNHKTQCVECRAETRHIFIYNDMKTHNAKHNAISF